MFSADGGAHWTSATLGADHGKYSFREWSVNFVPPSRGKYALQSLAINSIGETQPKSTSWNAGGYLRNAIETLTVTAT